MIKKKRKKKKKPIPPRFGTAGSDTRRGQLKLEYRLLVFVCEFRLFGGFGGPRDLDMTG